MKLLILEDEVILREGLMAKVKKTGLPLDIVGAAESGYDGLGYVKSTLPDIVITDIRMPGMDGIEFIRQARDLLPSMQFIIVSGFDHFEYARKAMSYGVTDYLLKPIEDDELCRSLIRMIDKLEEERDRSTAHSELLLHEKVRRETIRQQALTDFIQQGKVPVQDGQLLKLQERCTQFAALVLRFEPFSLPHYSFHNGDQELLWFAIENMITYRFQSTAHQGVLVYHALHQHELVYVLGLTKSHEWPYVIKWMEEIMYGIRKYLRLDLTIAVGSTVTQLNQIQESYQQAKQMLRNAIIHGCNKVYHDGMTKRIMDRRSLLSEEDERLLFQWLSQLNEAAIQRWIERRVGAIVQDPASTYSQLEWFCVDLHLLFRKYLLADEQSLEWMIGEMDDLLQWLQKLSVWQEAVAEMKQQVSNMIGHLSESRLLTDRDVMEEVRIYIENHFHEPLSLQSISERFYIHPNYFSRRFKERFGDSFIEYLTSVRMKQAAEWLTEQELKIHQIAAMVGFDDSAYFSSVFRKRFGVTPKQYREQAALGEEAGITK